MKKIWIGIVSVALSSAFVTGCGNFAQPELGTNTARPPRALQPVKNVTVEITPGSANFGTSPLVITRGTAVTWVNGDEAEHTATSDNGVFNSGALAPLGGSYSYTFTKPGIYSYHSTSSGDHMRSQIAVLADSPNGPGNGSGDPTTTTVTPDNPMNPGGMNPFNPGYPSHPSPVDCGACQKKPQPKPMPKPAPKPVQKPTQKPMPLPALY